MVEFPLLSIMTFLPVIGALLIIFGIKGAPEDVQNNAKHMALFTSLFTLAFALFMYMRFEPSVADFQFVEQSNWFRAFGIQYYMGVDGISVLFVLLSAFLTPICILASWNSVKKRTREYMAAFLILESLMIGTFCALDMVLFYVFFEAVLIPMFIIIGVWGGVRRVYSAYKFFLYTLLGSVLMLVAVLAIFLQSGSSSIPHLIENPMTGNIQYWLWLAFFASFAVKMPMWPVHTWLPDAHVEAPTAGSVILAGVLLKMGGYGFLRFSMPMLPEATEFFTPLVFWLSIIAIVYTSLVALVQEDMKKLIAYSSVAHMGFVTLGLFTLTHQGVEGAIFQMLSHGLISAALFLCVGVVYDRLHTREINRYGGIVKNMPRYATVFMIFMLGSVGLPGTSGFVGEFLVLLGTFKVNTLMAILAATGMVLGAAYMLVLYRRVVFGAQTNEDSAKMLDMNPLESFILIPLALLVIWLGVFPSAITNITSPAVARFVVQYEQSLEHAKAERQAREEELKAELAERESEIAASEPAPAAATPAPQTEPQSEPQSDTDNSVPPNSGDPQQ
ncbi:MAG: NADH-quinone oxidoreductase subunit M [Alphaproteobacteria bacterium]